MQAETLNKRVHCPSLNNDDPADHNFRSIIYLCPNTMLIFDKIELYTDKVGINRDKL